jgi:hypothetical protein
MRCVFAKGKMNEREIVSFAGASSFVIPVTDASIYFSAGDLIYISDPDYSDVEFLGPVTSITGNEIQCLSALKKSRLAGSRVWKPENYIMWPRKRSVPKKRRIETGIQSRFSAGSHLFLTRIREKSVFENLRFQDLRLREIHLFSDWIDSVIDGGLEIFTFTDEDSVVSTAAISSPELIYIEKSQDALLIDMEIRILDKGKYI